MKPFIKNDYPTLGIEEEFHLIDPQTADLCPRVNDVMDGLDPSMRDRVCYELLQCVLENRTGVYHTVDDLIKGISEGRKRIAESCRKLNITFAASGSHPFGTWQDQPFVDSEHYQWVRNNHRYVAHRLLAFGLHIHVGVQNEEAAIYIMNEMRRWAYPLLALSANSPYYEGLETGLASTRTHLFNSMPRTRFAPYFKKFTELTAYYEKLLATGDVLRPGDLWWCIRPQPPLGTVEFRIFDLPTSVRRIGALAAIVQAATAVYQDNFFAKKPAAVFYTGYLDQNWWRAMKDGLKADIIEPETAEIMPIRTQLNRLLEMIYPKARDLNSTHHLDYVQTMINEGSEAELQMCLYEKYKGDLRALELEIARQTVNFPIEPAG
jgi:carboxylate-amine ligase